MYRREKKILYMRWGLLFAGSFLLGVFIMNLGNELFLTEEGIFSMSVMNRLKYMEIDNGNFFGYVLRKRFGEVFGILLLSMTGIGAAALYAVICWLGILSGMIITAALIRFGIKGIFLIMGAAFPHQLLIIPAGIMLLSWCYENRSFMLAGNYRRQRGKQVLSLLWIGFVMMVSCILESYVNPLLFTDIVKIF